MWTNLRQQPEISSIAARFDGKKSNQSASRLIGRKASRGAGQAASSQED
jgi:hypothetical protein